MRHKLPAPGAAGRVRWIFPVRWKYLLVFCRGILCAEQYVRSLVLLNGRETSLRFQKVIIGIIIIAFGNFADQCLSASRLYNKFMIIIRIEGKGLAGSKEDFLTGLHIIITSVFADQNVRVRRFTIFGGVPEPEYQISSASVNNIFHFVPMEDSYNFYSALIEGCYLPEDFKINIR